MLKTALLGACCAFAARAQTGAGTPGACVLGYDSVTSAQQVEEPIRAATDSAPSMRQHLAARGAPSLACLLLVSWAAACSGQGGGGNDALAPDGVGGSPPGSGAAPGAGPSGAGGSTTGEQEVADCSPSTHLMPSTMFDLPEPLGPTTTVMPAGNSKRVLSAKLLKPKSSRALSMRGSGRRRKALHGLRGPGSVFHVHCFTRRINRKTRNSPTRNLYTS